MQDLVLRGDLYRIDDPTTSNYFTFAIVSRDKSRAHVTVYRRLGGANRPPKRLRLRGLDPEKNYRIPELDRTLSGATLMGAGLVPAFKRGDFLTLTYNLIEV